MTRTLTPVFSIIIAVLLYFFFISPALDDISATRAETDIYNDAINRYGIFNEKLEHSLSIKRDQNPVTVERLNQLVPLSVESAEILASLESIAVSHNMLFGNITTASEGFSVSNNAKNSSNQAGVINAELQTTDISFELVGTYEQLQEFLKDTENSLTLLEVTDISFTASDGLFEQFAITVRSYALPKTNN